MQVQPDFSELLALFNAHRVDFLIVGGYAVAFHGAPRYTGDIDLLVRPTPENALRIMTALEAFGFGQTGIEPADFESPGRVVQLGVPPVRIDLVTSIDAVTWESAEAHKEPGAYGAVPVWFLGRASLIANKRAVGRAKDLADLEALGDT